MHRIITVIISYDDNITIITLLTFSTNTMIIATATALCIIIGFKF